jgi:hypothetical protein
MTLIARLKVIALLSAALFAPGDDVFAQQPPVIIKDPLDVPREPGDGRKVLNLANGATLEVVGVSTHPSGPATWWDHRGVPMAEAPCDPSGNRMTSNLDTVFRAILVRVKGVPEGADASYAITPRSGGSSKGPATRGGRVVSGLTLMVAGFPKSAETCSVTFEVADGPWKAVSVTRGFGASAQSSSIGPSFVFGEAVATKDGGTAITVTHDIHDQAVRIAAVDLDNKEHASIGGGGAGVGKFAQLGAVFDLPPDAFREYRLQTRPYKRAELKGIALNPAKGD